MNQRSAENGHNKDISGDITQHEQDPESPGAQNNSIVRSTGENESLKAMGGDPLAGSGFEDEEPEEDFV